jgi:hypothetical protein
MEVADRLAPATERLSDIITIVAKPFESEYPAAAGSAFYRPTILRSSGSYLGPGTSNADSYQDHRLVARLKRKE